MRKIIFDGSPLADTKISGIGHMTLELIKALSEHPENEKKFEIILAISFDKKKLIERWDLKKIQIKSIPIPMRAFNILWKFDLIRGIDLIIGKGVYVFTNYRNWPLISSKSLTYVCDMGYLLHPEFVSPKNREFLSKNMNKWVKRSKKILTISKSAESEIITNLNIGKAQICVVPCGVDRKIYYKRSKEEIEKLKKKLNLSKKYILYLGNIEPRKNLINLIDAYKLLPEEIRKEHTLLLVGGSGWLNESIVNYVKKSQAEGYDIENPQEYIADELLPILHSGAAALVHPAYYEGFGISVIQAMACETPVVVSDNSSLTEVAAGAALLVDPKDARDISDKIEKVLTDEALRQELIKNGLERSRKYSWDTSAEILYQQTKEIFDEQD